MKKAELFFTFLLVPVDYIMIALAGISAYYIRYAEITAEIRPVIFNLPFEEYFKIVLAVAVVWLAIFALARLYRITASTKITDEIRRVILACSTGLVAIIIYMFWQRELFDSRFIILAAWALAIFYVIIARIFIRWLQRSLYAKGIGTHKIAVVGNTEITNNFITLISTSPKIGYEVIKKIKEINNNSLEELTELAKKRKIDEIVQVDPNLSRNDILQIMSLCGEYQITFKYAADLLGTKILKTEVMMMGGIPIVEVKATPLDGWGRIIKRIFDVIFSLVCIIILFPVYLAIALLIKMESRGPVIYKNERVSKEGVFNTYKFRSMYWKYCVVGNNQDALKVQEELIKKQNTKSGPVYKIGNDPRVTKIGKFIRRWSIDELPQFFNVLFGNMSIVGPRPHQPLEVEKYERHHKKVLAIKPGLTGLAQISGRSDLEFENEVKLDVYYIENWNFWLDVAIILRTPLAILRRRKAE